jgi:hypothetical protein
MFQGCEQKMDEATVIPIPHGLLYTLHPRNPLLPLGMRQQVLDMPLILPIRVEGQACAKPPEKDKSYKSYHPIRVPSMLVT